MTTKDGTGYFTACATARRVAFENNLHRNPEAFVTLGHRLQHVREQQNLALHQMAESIGVAVSTIRRWEADESTPTWFYLQLYCVTLEIELGILLDGVAPTERQVNHRLRNKVCLPARYWTKPEYLGGVR